MIFGSGGAIVELYADSGRAISIGRLTTSSNRSECPLFPKADVRTAGKSLLERTAFGQRTPRLHVGAVLLAAGEGRRMGSVAKPLIRLQGVPLISRKLVALSGAGVDEAVVTGYAFCLTGSPDPLRR